MEGQFRVQSLYLSSTFIDLRSTVMQQNNDNSCYLRNMYYKKCHHQQ